MNGCRAAFSLINRCRQAARPTLSSGCCLVNNVSSTKRHQRNYSDQNQNNEDQYPKLPMEKPLSFAQEVLQRGYKQVQFCAGELGMERDDILNVNEAAEKVLIFATECLAEEDFGTLEEKFTSEALEKARSYVFLMPGDQRKLLIYPGTSTGIFAKSYSFFFPWTYTATDTGVVLSYVGFQYIAESLRQTLWAITMAIPKSESSLSEEDWKVNHFHFETFAPQSEED